MQFSTTITLPLRHRGGILVGPPFETGRTSSAAWVCGGSGSSDFWTAFGVILSFWKIKHAYSRIGLWSHMVLCNPKSPTAFLYSALPPPFFFFFWSSLLPAGGVSSGITLSLYLASAEMADGAHEFHSRSFKSLFRYTISVLLRTSFLVFCNMDRLRIFQSPSFRSFLLNSSFFNSSASSSISL